jgi:hypothetical protein
MESRLGATDLSGVRLHDHPASARQLQASAYTIGHHVVFGTPKDETLLAHELAHVVQSPRDGGIPDRVTLPDHPAEVQARAAAAGGRPELQPQPASLVFRAPSPNPAPGSPVPANAQNLMPPTKSSKELWREWDRLTMDNKNTEALAVVPDLIAVMSLEEAMARGLELWSWLLSRGEKELAKKALKRLEDAWWMRFISIGEELPLTVYSDPDKIINAAEAQALAGDHETARIFFTTAFLFLQMLLVSYTDKRLKKLDEIGQLEEHVRDSGGFGFLALLRYQEPAALYAAMRRILSFYSSRRRQATAAGNTAESQKMADLDAELRKTIREKALFTGEGEGSRGLTLEGTQGTDKKRGEGYTLHGTNQKEEFVTPLPGTPLPDELGRHPAYTSSMEDLFTTLTGQEDFLTEILGDAEVRKEFAKRAPTVEDLNQMSVRIRLWQALFRSFQKQPSAGCATALCSLLGTVGRYLKHFTTHTQYNVDDFAKVSYLDRDQPTDLAGRALRDCGVYAVTTAYEVFRAVRGSSAKVSFQLFHTLEHVMLVIRDNDTQTHFVVNNDQIVGPKSGDASGTVAQAFADVIGHQQVLSVAVRSPELAGTKSDAAFKSDLWKSFQSGAHLELETEAPTGPDDTRSLAERSQDTVKHYYEALDRFDKGGALLHEKLDALLPRLSTASAQDLGTSLLPLGKLGLGMGQLLDNFAQNRIRAGFTKTPAVNMTRSILISAGRDGDHPLVRLGMALLFAQAHGHQLTAEQLAFLTVLRQIPGATFAARLADYAKAGHPPQF